MTEIYKILNILDEELKKDPAKAITGDYFFILEMTNNERLYQQDLIMLLNRKCHGK